jgi:hypothetical protein
MRDRPPENATRITRNFAPGKQLAVSRRRSYSKALRTQCRGRGTTFRETNESVATRFHALPTPAERTLTFAFMNTPSVRRS